MSRLSSSLLLALGALALVVVWRAQSPATPPIYDGVCVAPAYRTLASSPAPTSASKQYPPAAPGAFATSELTTGEDVPQAQVLMTDGTFVSAQPFTLTITPVAPPAAKPSNGSVDGNVYKIVATTANGSQLQPVDSAHGITILLRATAMSPARTLERLDGSTWTPLKTFLVGCGDTFEAVTPKLGEFAMVLPQAAAGNGGGSSGLPLVPIVAGGTAVILIVVLGLIRLGRTRAR